VTQVFPRAVVQWEDFHKRNAFRILENYRHRIRCFNDDIQGTAGVAVAGALAALRITRQPITEQRVIFVGAGEACTGIARLLAAAMREAGSTPQQIEASRLAFDSWGCSGKGWRSPIPTSASWWRVARCSRATASTARTARRRRKRSVASGLAS
jgi:malic enzyme